MAVSVRIEDEAFSDERYDDLAQLAGLVDADHARGKMARLWRQCTLENCHVLPRATVTRILGERGIDALVAARLGEVVDDGIRIRGTRGRIEWLKKLRSNGKFGKKGGRPRRNPDGFQNKPIRVSENAEKLTPPVPAPVPAPVPTKEERGSLPLALVLVESPKARTPKPKEPIHPDRVRVIATFHQRFKAAYGTKPTWHDKQVGQIGGLLKKHAADVLIERINFMFDGRSKWPPPPYSLDVFVANLDRFVEVAEPEAAPIRKVKTL